MILRTDRGSVTAEFAVALPAVLIVIGAVVAMLFAGSQRIVLQDAVADAARLEARGESARTVAAVTSSVPSARVSVDAGSEVVCVSATAPLKIAGVTVVQMTAKSCALAGGW